MSQIQGVVVSFVANTKVKKQGGGTYDAWELAYRNSDNELKTIAKPVQGLRFNPSLAAQLNALQAGDEFTMSLEKNPQGFLDVKNVSKGFSDGVSSPQQSTHSVGQPIRSGITPKSTYETPEERAKKQVIIVRQSTLNAAIASLGEGFLEPEAVVERAKLYEKYVYANVGKVANKFMAIDVTEVEALGPDKE